MKNLIGGLFDTQQSANRAYEALQNSGFADSEISMFVHKPRNRIARSMEISVQEIAKNAFLGALIVATLGGLAGFLIGRGTLPMAGLEPGSVTLNPMFLTASIVSGIVVGGLIGALLGAASRLLRSREKAEVMTREIEKDGVLVTVNVINPQSETTARGNARARA